MPKQDGAEAGLGGKKDTFHSESPFFFDTLLSLLQAAKKVHITSKRSKPINYQEFVCELFDISLKMSRVL